jgi:hypothetical protein
VSFWPQKQSVRLVSRQEAAAQAVLGLAAETIDEVSFAAWLRANVKPQ